MVRLTKEEKIARQESLKLQTVAEEFATEAAEVSTLPTKLLILVARASKFPNRISVDFSVEPLTVTFWDKIDRQELTFQVGKIPVSWMMSDLEYNLSKYEDEENEERLAEIARKNALSKLTPEEKKILGL